MAQRTHWFSGRSLWVGASSAFLVALVQYQMLDFHWLLATLIVSVPSVVWCGLGGPAIVQGRWKVSVSFGLACFFGDLVGPRLWELTGGGDQHALPHFLGFAPSWVAMLSVQIWPAAERLRRLEQDSMVTEKSLLATRAGLLRARLQPHFLFNTLHAVGVTARSDGEKAQRMLTLLGDLLRQVLIERADKEVSLQQELEMLQPYLELQQVRFQDRLHFEIDVPKNLREIAVPDLLLQPLVENAIEHGIEQRPGAGLVRITARLTYNAVAIEVHDDGPGPPEKGVPLQAGTGLGATFERLRMLYGSAGKLELERNELGGTTATVWLPLRKMTHAA